MAIGKRGVAIREGGEGSTGNIMLPFASNRLSGLFIHCQLNVRLPGMMNSK